MILFCLSIWGRCGALHTHMGINHSLFHLLSHKFDHSLIIFYQGWYALIVSGTLSIKVEFSHQGVGRGGDIETLLQILVFMLNTNNNNQVNFVEVSIIISKSSLSTLLTPNPLFICSDFPISLDKMCFFFSLNFIVYIPILGGFFLYCQISLLPISPEAHAAKAGTCSINFPEKFKVVEPIPVDEAFASSLGYLL